MDHWPINIPTPDTWDTDYQFRRDDQLVVDVPAWLRHRNLRGEEGSRLVRVVRLTPYGADFEIATYEEPGRVFHTFLASRILEFVDVGSGKRIDDFVAFLTEVHRRSVRGQVFLALRMLEPELLVLVEVARASGQMRAKQREPILAYVRRAAPEFNLDPHRFAEDLATIGLGRGHIPDALRFIASKGAAHASDVLVVAETVAATRTGPKGDTDRLMAKMRKALTRSGSGTSKPLK